MEQWRQQQTLRTRRKLQCGPYKLELGERTYVMGILNATPDSFSDGGRHNNVEAAVQRAVEMVEQGADIIDVGGESTRPGSAEVSLEEELERVVPVIRALRQVIDVPISVDTYKAETARQALEAGAHIINDIWGAKRDTDMAKVAAEYECPIILMHNRTDMNYSDFVRDVLHGLRESVEAARLAGVAQDRIILDPGIGFAKTYEHNLQLMVNLQSIVNLGYPVLLGTSRKTFIRYTLNLPADQVAFGTASTIVLGIAQGCDFIRVHDVHEMKQAALMTDAMMEAGAKHKHIK